MSTVCLECLINFDILAFDGVGARVFKYLLVNIYLMQVKNWDQGVSSTVVLYLYL